MIDSWSTCVNEWNAEHGSAHFVAASHLEWNRRRQNLVRYESAMVSDVPVIFATATDEGVESGILPTTLWLALWGRIEDGRESEFVRALGDFTREQGKFRVMFGADEFHLSSGVPMTSASGRRLVEATTAAGFTGSEVADYVGDLSSQATANYVSDAARVVGERGLVFARVTTKEDRDALETFLAREFPGRWTREFRFWRHRDDVDRAFWMRLEDGTGIVGFARMAVRGRVRPLDQGWTPGALRLPLDPANPTSAQEHDSCLGPIGVASSQRGRGTGKALLGLVLRTLRENRASSVCIDWTNAFKYYEPLEYGKVRRIWTCWMDGL